MTGRATGLLLAAGAGRRMGTPKALLTDDAGTALTDVAVDRLLGGAPLADVAFDAGFADQPHFTREFRTLVGCAPTDFPFLQDVPAAA